MTQPSSFILTNDFATLKNDASTTLQITAPGSASVSAGSYVTYTSDVVLGSRAAINRIQLSSSKDSNIRYSTQAIDYGRTGTVSGSPAPYDILAFVSSLNSTTVRFTVYISNPYGSTLTTASGNETFTFYTVTFIPPF